jgi:pimeloyl-ACP methyl ester carboxylesterase
MEPISHFFYSHRLKLQFWDYGTAGKPTLLLVHGGLDHARNWDWVARALREDFHVIAADLRGHGNSTHAAGALYSVPEHVLDLSALADVVNAFPVYLIGHSYGGIIASSYAAAYPERVKKLISIEGLGLPPQHRAFTPASKRLRRWIEEIRQIEKREARSYATLDDAVARMQEANPHLSDEQARHLTLHGTNWNADGSLAWKFDNFARPFAPQGFSFADQLELFSQIVAPTLLFWGEESPFPAPDADGRLAALPNARFVKVPRAGHWVHHDQLDFFLAEAKPFLLAD